MFSGTRWRPLFEKGGRRAGSCQPPARRPAPVRKFLAPDKSAPGKAGGTQGLRKFPGILGRNRIFPTQKHSNAEGRQRPNFRLGRRRARLLSRWTKFPAVWGGPGCDRIASARNSAGRAKPFLANSGEKRATVRLRREGAPRAPPSRSLLLHSDGGAPPSIRRSRPLACLGARRPG